MDFRGSFDYSLDSKNRLNVPPKFRPAFSNGVVLSKGIEPCVWVWAPAEFQRFTDQVMGGLNPISGRRRKLTRFVAGGSYDTELDGSGRVTLNPVLLAHAGIEKEVVVVGVLDKLEVWARDRWLAEQEELPDDVAGIAEGVGDPS